MKILIISRGIPNSKDPQEGCFEWDQAKALATNGHQVIVMSVDSRLRKYWRKFGITNIEKDGVIGYKLFRFPTSIIRRLISYKLGYWIESLWAKQLYKKIVKKYGQFDIVHSHYLNCSFYAALIKRKFGCKLVATEHWSELKKEPLSDFIKYLGDNTYKYVDKLISVSNHLGISIKNKFDIDYSVVHNLIDDSLLETALPETNNPKFTIISVGSLQYIKGFDILIKAFAKSMLLRSKAILKIIGNGPERERLQRLIKDSNLTENIILLGQLNKSQVYVELHKADLYVLSSRSENFSVALIEATANGVPAIGTLCGGVQEYPVSDVEKIPVEDIDSMRNALENGYNNSKNVDRINLQNETLSLFSPNAIVSQLENIYQQVLN